MGSNARAREVNVVEDWEKFKVKAKEVGFEPRLERALFRLKMKGVTEVCFGSLESALAYLKGWKARKQYVQYMTGESNE